MLGWIFAGLFLVAWIVTATAWALAASAYDDARATAEVRGEEIDAWRRKHQALRDQLHAVLDAD